MMEPSAESGCPSDLDHFSHLCLYHPCMSIVKLTCMVYIGFQTRSWKNKPIFDIISKVSGKWNMIGHR